MNKLALLGGAPVRKKKFKHPTIIGVQEKKSVIRLLNQGKLSGFFENFLGGPEVRKFE